MCPVTTKLPEPFYLRHIHRTPKRITGTGEKMVDALAVKHGLLPEVDHRFGMENLPAIIDEDRTSLDGT